MTRSLEPKTLDARSCVVFQSGIPRHRYNHLLILFGFLLITLLIAKMLPLRFPAALFGLFALGAATTRAAIGENDSSTTRTYYVAAVEEEWDYMPR